ncbi:MAG: META domain-containing protein [Rhodobacteraceae bacterium]|nr:META domain-containing protein [Paracoccaceae bacterium]
MRPLFAVLLALFPLTTQAQTAEAQTAPIDWQLVAIDGVVTDMRATLRLSDDGTISGQAPCNRWSAMNGETLPALNLAAIRATRMACDRLADEQLFFDTLAAMTRLTPEGSRNLVLTGPDGRSMEFVSDLMNSLTTCKTCTDSD